MTSSTRRKLLKSEALAVPLVVSVKAVKLALSPVGVNWNPNTGTLLAPWVRGPAPGAAVAESCSDADAGARAMPRKAVLAGAVARVVASMCQPMDAAIS